MNIYAVIFAFVFISAPFVLYYVSLDIDLNAKNLDDKEIAEVKEIAYLTWCYFKDNLKEEYHYLIPDNYQENREEKLDFRTSPTGIGFSMLSIVSAVSLEFISYDEGKELIKKILTTVESNFLISWVKLAHKSSSSFDNNLCIFLSSSFDFLLVYTHLSFHFCLNNIKPFIFILNLYLVCTF